MDDIDILTSGAVTAALDQAHAALRDLAGLLGRYRSQLVAAGFHEEQILELCLDLQLSVLTRAPSDPDQSDERG